LPNDPELERVINQHRQGRHDEKKYQQEIDYHTAPRLQWLERISIELPDENNRIICRIIHSYSNLFIKQKHIRMVHNDGIRYTNENGIIYTTLAYYEPSNFNLLDSKRLKKIIMSLTGHKFSE